MKIEKFMEAFKTPIIECIPNFSEGRNKDTIQKIATAISTIKNVAVLHIDRGEAANRTVITFAGTPEGVFEAAFQAIKTASELIDMRKHSGEHPRIGATDVCPLVPISGITLEETALLAQKLGKRVSEELAIPIFLYEASQNNSARKNLAHIRRGEYEGMSEKIKTTEWAPDYGPKELSKKAGATVIGARNFLIAYNININSRSVDIAKKIAQEIRESGYYKLNKNGEKKHSPGLLKSVKAIGWFIKEFGCAQVSMNIINFKDSSLYDVYETTRLIAAKHGVKTTGSELIGLTPKEALLTAGKQYLNEEKMAKSLSDDDIIQVAINRLNLGELKEFKPHERIIEHLLQNKKTNSLET